MGKGEGSLAFGRHVIPIWIDRNRQALPHGGSVRGGGATPVRRASPSPSPTTGRGDESDLARLGIDIPASIFRDMRGRNDVGLARPPRLSGCSRLLKRSSIAFVTMLFVQPASSRAQDILYAQDQGTAVEAKTEIRGRWSQRNLSPDARADAALAAMTQQEKIAILNADPLGVPRLGIPAVKETDASLGVANIGNMRKGFVATALPASLLLGSSWDPDLAFRGGAMIGSEARASGYGILLGGGANLIRDPRAGRNFEYISEDPLLTGVLAGRSIAGIQSNRIISTVKHFAFNNQGTAGRSTRST